LGDEEDEGYGKIGKTASIAFPKATVRECEDQDGDDADDIDHPDPEPVFEIVILRIPSEKNRSIGRL